MKEYFVTLTFDLSNAASVDYECADRNLAAIGLHRSIVGDSGNSVDLPFNSYGGKFNGLSASSVRDYVQEQARLGLNSCNVRGRLFVSVGGDWAWGSTAINNQSRAYPYA